MVKRLLAIMAGFALVLTCASASSAFDWNSHPAEFMARLMIGEKPGVSYWLLQGRNIDIDAATAEDVWDYGGTATVGGGVIQWAAAATAEGILVSSDNGLDTMDLYVEGLDADGDEISETVTLAGLTFTPTILEYWRIHRVTAQGGTAPVGNVYIHIDLVDGGLDGIPDTLPGDIRGYIPIGEFETRQGFYTCPRARRCWALNTVVNAVSSASPGEGFVQVRESITDPWTTEFYSATPFFTRNAQTHAVMFEALQDLKTVGDSTAANITFGSSALIVIEESN